MTTQIPPLVCHTPPPIDDFDEADDDQQQHDIPDDDDFGDFESNVSDFRHEDQTLPSPLPLTPNKTDIFLEIPEIIPEIPEPPPVEMNVENEEKINLQMSQKENGTAADDVMKNIPTERNESPPSLILSQTNFSDNDDNFNEFEQEYFQQGEETNPVSFDDNISIPSLNFDDESPPKSSTNAAEMLNENIETSDKEIPPPASNNIDDEILYRLDDNTENDFTDYTSVSNEKSTHVELMSTSYLETADFSIDDEFAHVDAAPSADSQFISQSKTDNIDHTSFDADFSRFESFQAFSGPGLSEARGGEDWANENTNNDDDDFDDFQDFAQCAAAKQEDKSIELDDDDDDFGEFSDFKQSAPVESSEPVPPEIKPLTFSKDNFLKVINEMFPTIDLSDDCDVCVDSNNNSNSEKVLATLKDFDSMPALEFQYSSSTCSKSLVRALGIDSRNILFGPKWNSSMPRFAANLSFNPLEPMKPMSSSSSSCLQAIPTSSSMSAKFEAASSATGASVPAVQFDWNSSGLVNPLDGVQEILQESANQSKNGSKSEILDKEVSKVAAATTDATEEQLSNDYEEERQFSPQSFNVRTIKLPETHIFTPNKCINPISLEVTDRDEEEIPKIDKNIITKEYRDIEYSLDKSMGNKSNHSNEDFNDEFSDFQSVPTNNTIFQPSTVLPQSWPEADSKKTNMMEKYSKPVFGTSPTEELDKQDDEFTDFQAAVPSEPERKEKSSPILLCPSILMPQISNNTVETNRSAKINWPEPGIDPEELARFEAAFPKCKINSNNSVNTSNNTSGASENQDDEEWSDFVSSEPAPAKPSLNETKNNTTDDDWSDFIYSTPVPSSSSSTSLTSSSQNHTLGNNFTAGPKFTSWNTPQLPPPQFNSWNSTNLYYNSQQFQHHQQQHKVPTISYNNNIYSNNHQQQQANIKVPNISLLPDMSFIAPTISASKPSSHSFINNIISNNTFTKK